MSQLPEGEPGGINQGENPTPTFEERMIRALSIWAEGHPDPDAPVLDINGKVLTPRELVQEVANNTEIGQIQMETFRGVAFPRPSTDPRPGVRQITDARDQDLAESFMRLTDSFLSGDYPPSAGTPAPRPRPRR